MDPSYCKDMTKVYNGMWHKRRHTSHTGVGSIIDFHTDLILDAIVLSNHCLGCQTGPKPGDAAYDSWLQHPICQKNTDAKSGSMEVEANSSDVAAMQHAVMATYRHVTSTDYDPHHELFPEGAEL